MIVVIPAPNDDNVPTVMIDDNKGSVATVDSAMSRNAASLLSTWAAVQCTSLADVDPLYLPWPSSCIYPP
jgi:hypothetical protein